MRFMDHEAQILAFKKKLGETNKKKAKGEKEVGSSRDG